MDTFERNQISRFMDAIEDGNIPFLEASEIIQKVDPLLAYFLLRYLREKHPPQQEKSGASGRLISFLTEYNYLTKMTALPKGEGAMLEWFNDSYAMSDFFKNRQEFVDLIVEKIEN